MKKWVCTVCGYVYEGENPPAECPQCHVLLRSSRRWLEREHGLLSML